MDTTAHQIDQVPFSNSFVEELPGEVSLNNRPHQVPGYCYSIVNPTPVSSPHLLAWSDEVAALLGLAKPMDGDTAVQLLAGNIITSTMKPFAARYGGHQFGSWAGQLGDGRAITLGEIEATDGSQWEIQLKGAGPTPYSRRADGRAVLRSSLREFLCSEAMHFLGVPTTRALSLVGTGDKVVRDMFYDGDPQPEKGAIVARVAPSFIRFGNFEIMAAMDEAENLRALADYTIRHFYPELGEPSNEVYLQWFEEICRRTAVMIAHWMTVGFVHGVMNTDNMSILGLTIDYGPYGWLEPYEPHWTPNTTDFGQRRYAFGGQPQIGLWNLTMLARALYSLVPQREELIKALELYRFHFTNTYHEMMLTKLGLTAQDEESDASFVDELNQGLLESASDMTLFFRRLSQTAPQLVADAEAEAQLFEAIIEDTSYSPDNAHQSLRQWLAKYARRLRNESADAQRIQETMLRVNPKYVLRNYLAQQAIDAAEAGDLSVLETLMTVLRNPYEEQLEYDYLAAKRPEWARTKPGCATLSCSS